MMICGMVQNHGSFAKQLFNRLTIQQTHFFFFDAGVNAGFVAGPAGAAAAGMFDFVSFVCATVSKLLTVQYSARPEE